MNELQLLTILTSIPPTVAAIIGLAVGVLNVMKLNQVHLLVNSNLADVKAELRIANQTIAQLTEALRDKTH